MATRRRARRQKLNGKRADKVLSELPNQQRHAARPHNSGIDISEHGIARNRTALGLTPQPVPLRLPANATPAQRAAAQEQMAREIDQICDLFSQGKNEHEIRAELGLSRKRFEHRVRRMKKAALDAPLAWTKFLTGAQQDIKRLYYIFTMAMGEAKPRYSVAVDAISKMHDVRCSIMEQGQEAGVYDRKPDDFGVGLHELTLALLMGTVPRGGLPAGLPKGNMHSAPPADVGLLPPVVREALSAPDSDADAADDFDEDDIEDGEIVDDDASAA